MLDKAVNDVIADIARRHGLPVAGLIAVCEVESGGRIFAEVRGRMEPLIRFEGHYFHRLVPATKRAKAVVAGLASARAGAVRNPAGQARRWKLLRKAIELDRDAALQSVSWGIGQVMGVHWRWLDYASLDAFVHEVRSGAAGQVELMVRYICKSGLDANLREGDWAGFARGYNGPGYRRYRYDERISAAHSRITGTPAAGKSGRHSPACISLGWRGSHVTALQRDLSLAGYQVSQDGDFGPATMKAVKAFQQEEGIVVDGIAGPLTLEHLARRLP